MRDPERIDRIIEKLRRRWHEVPDQRLGQLIVDLTRRGPHDTFHLGTTVFAIEDDLIEAALDEEDGSSPGV